MNVRYVYNGTLIGSGWLQTIPREGNFVEFQTVHKIFVVTDVMFKTVLNGDVGVLIYLSDIRPEKEHKLRNYK